MDLRRTLVVRLSLSFAGLILAFSVVWLQDLRDDALDEQVAAARLVDLLAAADGPDAAAWISAALARGGLRHVNVTLLPAGEPSPPQQPPSPARLLGLATDQVDDRRIPVGGQVLLIRADPDSEFREQLWASMEILLMLLLFCAACLAMVGGTLAINDRSGGGVALTVRVPVAEEEERQ